MLRTGSQYLEASNYTGPISQRPLSISFWVKDRDAANANTGLYRFGVSATDCFVCYYQSSSAGPKVMDKSSIRSQEHQWGISTIQMRNKWHQITCVHETDVLRRMYRDNYSGLTPQNLSVTVSKPTFFRIGRGANAVDSIYNNCDFAEIAIWAKVLSDEDRWNLYRNMYSPLLVAPEYLVHYWPLGGRYGNDTYDIVGGWNFQWAGTGTKEFVEGPHGMQYPKLSRNIFLPISQPTQGGGGSQTLSGALGISANSSLLASSSIDIHGTTNYYNNVTMIANSSRTIKQSIILKSNLVMEASGNKILQSVIQYYAALNANFLSSSTISSFVKTDLTSNAVLSARLAMSDATQLTNNLSTNITPSRRIGSLLTIRDDASINFTPKIIITGQSKFTENLSITSLNHLVIKGNSVLSNSETLSAGGKLVISGMTRLSNELYSTTIGKLIIAGGATNTSTINLDIIHHIIKSGSATLISNLDLNAVGTLSMNSVYGTTDNRMNLDLIINPKLIIRSNILCGNFTNTNIYSRLIIHSSNAFTQNAALYSDATVVTNSAFIFPITLYINRQNELALEIIRNKNIDLQMSILNDIELIITQKKTLDYNITNTLEI